MLSSFITFLFQRRKHFVRKVHVAQFFSPCSNFCYAHASNSNTIYDRNKQKATIVAFKTHLSGAWSSPFVLFSNHNSRENWRKSCALVERMSVKSDLNAKFSASSVVHFIENSFLLSRPLNHMISSICKMFSVFLLFSPKLLNLIFYY